MATNTTPTASTDTDWRVPKPSDKTAKLTEKVPHNGDWYVVGSGLGMTVAEQKARVQNTVGGDWEWGFRVYAQDRSLVSDLAVRWVGK